MTRFDVEASVDTSSLQSDAPLQLPRATIGSFERDTVTEHTRQLLCLFASGDRNQPLPRIAVDWEAVFQAVCRNGLVGLTYAYLKHHRAEEYPPQTFRRWVSWTHLLANASMVRKLQQVKRVLAGLKAEGVECLVLKGPAIASLVYPEPSLRWYSDLDIHVRDRDVDTAHRVLSQLGMHLEESRASAAPKLVPHAPGNEWHYWAPDQSLLVELHGDDLLHCGLVPRDYEGLWSRTTDLTIQGTEVKALALDDQLITLAAHVHYHGYTRLNWLSDLAFIVRDHASEVDWQRLVRTVRSEELQVPVYYTLHFLEKMLGVSAPEWVMDSIRPDRFRRWLHERYLPEHKVISLQPMARPDFSFYFLPLFKRLVPDLLVMGRRGEKLHYLVRLLAPPPGWLRHYYGLHEHDAIVGHYMLHPLKLGWYYLRSLGSAASWVWRGGRVDDPHGPETWWSILPRSNHAAPSCH